MTKHKQKKWTEHDDLFVRRHAKIMSVELIAYHLGRTVKSIECYALRNKIKLEFD